MSTFEVIAGVEGDCLVLDGTRIAGPKPWGGGPIIKRFETKKRYVPERICQVCITEKIAGGYMPMPPTKICECSTCGGSFEQVFGAYEYCPRCGAKVVNDDVLY